MSYSSLPIVFPTMLFLVTVMSVWSFCDPGSASSLFTFLSFADATPPACAESLIAIQKNPANLKGWAAPQATASGESQCMELGSCGKF